MTRTNRGRMDEVMADGQWTDRQLAGSCMDRRRTDRWMDKQSSSHMFELLPLPQAEGGSQVKLGAYRHEDS